MRARKKRQRPKQARCGMCRFGAHQKKNVQQRNAIKHERNRLIYETHTHGRNDKHSFTLNCAFQFFCQQICCRCFFFFVRPYSGSSANAIASTFGMVSTSGQSFEFCFTIWYFESLRFLFNLLGHFWQIIKCDYMKVNRFANLVSFHFVWFFFRLLFHRNGWWCVCVCVHWNWCACFSAIVYRHHNERTYLCRQWFAFFAKCFVVSAAPWASLSSHNR